MKNLVVVFSTLAFIVLVLFLLSMKTEKGEPKIDDVRKDSLTYYLTVSDSFTKQKEFKKAISLLESAIHYSSESGKDSLYYKRAQCFLKINKKQEAVNELRLAKNQGHKEAAVLYEKINPLRKRVSHYITRCRDGSISYSKGRGTCSYHGGVSNWNEPVYETYRKY